MAADPVMKTEMIHLLPGEDPTFLHVRTADSKLRKNKAGKDFVYKEFRSYVAMHKLSERARNLIHEEVGTDEDIRELEYLKQMELDLGKPLDWSEDGR